MIRRPIMRKTNISHLYADAKRAQELIQRRKKVEALKKKILAQRTKLQAKKSPKMLIQPQLNRLQKKHEQVERVLEKVESHLVKARTGKPPARREKQKARALKLGTTGVEARAVPLPKNLQRVEGTSRLKVFAAAGGEPPKKSGSLSGSAGEPGRREPERREPEGQGSKPVSRPASGSRPVFRNMDELRDASEGRTATLPRVAEPAVRAPRLREEIVSPKTIVSPMPRFISANFAEFNRKEKELKEKRERREEFQPEKIDLDVLREEKVLKAELNLLNAQDKVERLSLKLLKIEIKLEKALAAKWWAFGKLRAMFWRWRFKRAGLKKKKIGKVITHLNKVFELTKKFFREKFGLKRKEVEREISLTERDFKAISLEVEKRKNSFIQQLIQQVQDLREKFSSTSLGERVSIGEKVFNALERKAASLKSAGEIIEFNSKLSIIQQLFNEKDFGNGLRILGEVIGKPFNELQKDFKVEPLPEPARPEAREAPEREEAVVKEAERKAPPLEWGAEEEDVDAAAREAVEVAEEREEEEEERRVKGVPKGEAREREFRVPEKANLAIIKVDLAGYTALSEKFGEEHVEQLDAIKNKFQEMVLGHVDKHHGVFYLGEGDAVYALFDSMSDALKTLYSVQGALSPFSESLRRGNETIKERLTNDLSVSSAINAIQVDEQTMKRIDSLDAISTHLGPQIQDTIKLQSAAKAGQILVNARFSDELSGARFREITVKDPRTGEDKHYFLVEATGEPIGDLAKKGKEGTVRMKVAHAAFGITRQELKPATMLFTSIKNFDQQLSSLTAARREALREECFHRMRELTSQRGGTFVKKMGSAGAFISFGADRVTEKDIYFATQLALEIDKAINAIGKKYGETINLRLGSGINFGRVGITWFGDHPDLGGDRVNVAARFMQDAKEGEVLLSDRVRRSIKGGEFEVEALGPRTYKGVSRPINIFTVKREVLRNKLDVLFGEKATDFVGREEELDSVNKHVLEHLINAKAEGQIVSGQNRFFNVIGDAGLGKSRIRFESIKKLRGEGFDAITSSIPIYGKDKNSEILHGWLRDIFKLTGRESREEAIAEVSRQVKEFLTESISPEYADEKLVDLRTKIVLNELGFELEEVKDIDPKARVELIQSTLIDLIKAKSLRNPMILGLEDLHYAKDEAVKDRDVMDKRIENFLSKIVDSLQGFNVVFWVDQRPGISHRFLDEGNRLELSRLDDETALDLSKKFLGVNEIPSDLEPYISKAKGVPYFIEQMLGFLKDTGVIQVADKQCKINAEKLRTVKAKMPGTINAAIAQRIDRLLSTAKNTIQTASALGREFDANILRDLLTENERTDLDRNLAFLEELGLIKQLPSHNDARPFIFAHDLTQEVAYSMMPEAKIRIPLHEKSLQLFEGKVMDVEAGAEQDKVYAEVIGDLLHHARFSGNPEKLVHYLIEAGIIAKERWKNNLAMDYFTEALSLLSKNDERQIGVRTYMYEILEAQGKYDEGIQLLHEAWVKLGGTVEELYAEEKT